MRVHERIVVRCVGTDHLLDEGVVCGVHAGAQRIKALAITVIRRVSSRGQDPVLQSQRAVARVRGTSSIQLLNFLNLG